MIIYEYPFNERIRTYLRLEHLFLRLMELATRRAALDHHFAISTLFEIIDVGARADLKSDVLRDLERQRQLMASFRGNPSISQTILDDVLRNLDESFSILNAQPGKTGQVLTENEWLMSIRSRISIPGGTCEFDLPSYFAWQHQDTDRRLQDIREWTTPIVPLANAVRLLLRLIRDSGSTQKMMSTSGTFQQNLPQGKTFQLLRLALDEHLGLIPEISGNRLMVSIRFLCPRKSERAQTSDSDCSFELTLCS